MKAIITITCSPYFGNIMMFFDRNSNLYIQLNLPRVVGMLNSFDGLEKPVLLSPQQKREV